MKRRCNSSGFQFVKFFLMLLFYIRHLYSSLITKMLKIIMLLSTSAYLLFSRFRLLNCRSLILVSQLHIFIYRFQFPQTIFIFIRFYFSSVLLLSRTHLFDFLPLLIISLCLFFIPHVLHFYFNFINHLFLVTVRPEV